MFVSCGNAKLSLIETFELDIFITNVRHKHQKANHHSRVNLSLHTCYVHTFTLVNATSLGISLLTGYGTFSTPLIMPKSSQTIRFLHLANHATMLCRHLKRQTIGTQKKFTKLVDICLL